MPNMLAVYASPRKGGNSSVLLDYFLEGVHERPPPERPSPARPTWSVERVYLRELRFTPCRECGGCGATGVCRMKDDMSGLYDKLLSFERIVLALPVFFLGPPALAKAFIDRAQALWVRKYVLGIKPEGAAERRGFLLSTGGFKKGGKVFDCNRSIVRAFYQSCGFRYAGELFVPGVDHFGELASRADVHRDAREAGRLFSGG